MLLLSVVDYCGVPCRVIGAVCQVARMLNDHVCTWTPYFWGLSSCFLKYNFIACASCVFCSVVMWFCAHVLVVRTKRRTMVGFAIWPWASGFIIDSALLVQLHTSQAIKVFVGCKQARCAWATCSIDTRQVRNERPLIAVCAEHWVLLLPNHFHVL